MDKDFSTEKCKAIFQDNYEIAKRVLSSSSVEELENIEAIPSEIVEYFRNYKALDDKCVIRPLLARGALYYDGVVYEMFHSKMESAIMGGGHGTMFGVTRVGASFGLERLLMCINKNKNTKVSTFYTQEETFFQRRIGNDLDTKIEQVGIRNENVKQLKLEKIHR